jgi:flagellar export protein FliJ
MAQVWRVLSEKFAQEVKKTQVTVATFVAKKKTIEDQMEKLDQLISEYSEELFSSKKKGLTDVGASNLRRQFITEVQQARDGLNRENSMLEIDLREAREDLREKRLEEMKVKKMLERDAERTKQSNNLQERKEFESTALNQFNLRNA